MGDPIEDIAEAILVVAEGGRIVRANGAAAAVLGMRQSDLAGRIVGLADAANREREPLVGGPSVLNLFADLSSLALFSHDASCTINTWNRGAERIFGYAEDEVVGQTFQMLVPQHLRPDLESVEARVANGERVDRVFTEIRRKDGMPIPIALSVSPIINARSGEYMGAAAVAEELTEIRLAQAALAEVEERFQEWEALAHVGRWLWDVGTDAVQWSDEMHRMHGVDPYDFDGTLDAHIDVMHPDDGNRITSLMRGAVADGRPFEDGYRIVGDDGETLWFTVRAEPTVGSAGNVVGLRGVSHAVPLNVDQRGA